MPAVIETVTGVLNLATALSDAAREDGDARRKLRPVISALRGIYFTPRGIRDILNAISQGERPGSKKIREVLLGFNDSEWQVGRLVDRLDFDALEVFDLSIRQRRLLQEIAWGKRDLRRELQDFLNGPLTRGQYVDPKHGQLYTLLSSVESGKCQMDRPARL